MANFNIDYLIVAGGGGGTGGVGNGNGTGGGGAGGLITTTTYNGTESAFTAVTSTSYDVVVGSFGAGGTGSSLNNFIEANRGLNGNNSKFDSIEAIGGGGGGAIATNYPSGADGGSGGGGAPYSNSGGSGTTNQGNSGGAGSSNPGSVNRYRGGGGGGASQSGANGDTSGNGGDGISYTSGQNSITGSASSYAGGGGGGVYSIGVAAGTGGLGGGGNGAQNAGNGSSALANTGSGGGGAAGAANYNGGNGGSGVVILRYATADVASYTVTGAAPTETIDGTDTILSFTTAGTGTITFTTPIPPFSGTKVTTPVTDFNKFNTEEGLKIPSGTSSEQPTGVEGMVRNDTTQSSRGSASAISYYNGTDWRYFENELNTSFNTVLYTGTSLTNAITGVGFSPDLVWLKQRNSAQAHALFDTVRGTNNFIMSNSTSAENTRTTDTLSSFDADGFTLTPYSSDAFINYTGRTMVAWCWKAGGLANKSAYFNGSNSIVKSTNLGAAFNSQTTLSIAGWFKTSTSTSRMTIASFSNTAVGSTDLWIGLYANENTIAFRNSVEGAPGLLQVNDTGGSNLRDGNWHHVVFTADSNGTRVYVDGSQLTGYTYSFGNSSTNIQMPSINQFSIGANQDSSASGGQWFMNGIINQVRVFTSALSASQATELYNETVAENSVLNFPNGAGCVAAYPLGENANGVDGLYNGSSSNVTFGKPGYLTRNTEGTIESTVSANNDLGFSVVSYTGNGTAGSTVGHGLASTPEMVIVKSLTNTANQSWSVYQADVGNNGSLTLELANTPYYDIGYWNNTSPTSSVFTLGNYAVSNQNNADYIAYCFASKPNYSKTGSYLGNGNATGPIVTLGFEPAWLMFKCTTQSNSNWIIIDNKRATSNPRTPHLRANSSAQDDFGANEYVDFTSTGFQPKGVSNYNNNSGGQTYIYLAFANTI